MSTRIITVNASVGVSSDLAPNLFQAKSGALLATIRTAAGEGAVQLHAHSPAEMLGWLLSLVAAVEPMVEVSCEALGCDSTHPVDA